MEKLTKAQEGALQVVQDGRWAAYDRFMRVGANGVTLKRLVVYGLMEVHDSPGGKLWSITESGRAALAKEQRE